MYGAIHAVYANQQQHKADRSHHCTVKHLRMYSIVKVDLDDDWTPETADPVKDDEKAAAMGKRRASSRLMIFMVVVLWWQASLA
jgi:hypothetical protein